jgi:hypothetical protein
MFSTGMRTDTGQFSREVIGTIVGEYVHIAGRLTDRRWELIMGLCNKHNKAKETPGLETHSVQVNRRALYNPSSPMKGSDEY